MPVILPRLSSRGPIANKDGTPTIDFTLFISKLAQAIEEAFNDSAAVQAQILAILNGDTPFNALNVNGATVATLGTAATVDVGTAPGEVAAADDPRITDALNTSTGGTVSGATDFAAATTFQDEVDFSSADVKLGAANVSADAPIAGYIEIKDSAGVTRKLTYIA